MIEIRRATPQDEVVEAIFSILSDVYEVSPWSLDQIQSDLENPHSVYFLAYDGKEIQGFLAIQEMDFEVEITQIAVRKAVQGRQIATALLTSLTRNKEVFLEVRQSNRGAQLFYEKNGFKEIGRRNNYYHNPFEDALLMKRESDER